MYKRISIVLLLALVLYIALPAKGGVESYILATEQLDEASGLAHSRIHNQILYSHNDSGGAASIFAIDYKGNLISEIQVSGVQNRDWEDIATGIDPVDGKAYIYIGEIGDNRARYSSIFIYRIEEPASVLQDSLIISHEPEIYEIRYEDGPRDAEALFMEPDSGDLYILSKREERVGIYRLTYPLSTSEINVAQRLGDMEMGWVTAADISADGSSILVKNYPGIRRYKRAKNQSVFEALQRKGKILPYQLEPQGEAVCFDAKGKGYFTLSEAAPDTPQVLYYYK